MSLAEIFDEALDGQMPVFPIGRVNQHVLQFDR